MDTIERDLKRHDVLFHDGSGDAAVSVGDALKRLERVLHAYERNDEADGATAKELLSEIERLRRFVMVRGALKAGLYTRKAEGEETLGRRLSETLFSMIVRNAGGDVVMTRPERLALDRTSRRAIGCLTYLGSIDARFVSRNGTH
jgi:hypothetical protein